MSIALNSLNQTTTLSERLQLIDFAKATPSTLKAHTEQALQHAQKALDDIESQACHDVQMAFDKMKQFNQLVKTTERYFHLVSHLNSVMSNDDIRQTHHELLPKLSAFATRAGQSTALYHLYKNVQQNFEQLADVYQTQDEKQAINLALRDFVLSGVALPDDKKAQFADIERQLAMLSAKFADNLMDATAHFAHPLTPDELSGISQTGLALLKSAGERYRATHPDVVLPSDYVATLEAPMYLAVMQYADNRALREKIYHAYHTRASDQSTDSTEFDNSDIMTQIVNLRQQKAQLLGMKDYSEYSLATKMANDSQQVEHFLLKLCATAKPKAQAELDEMVQFAKTLGLDELQPWDMAYVAEKIRLAKFNLDSDSLRPYFPLPVVLDGLFGLIEALFGVRVVQADKKDYHAWHDDVLFCQLFDQDDTLLGGLYLDLFARFGKQGGAWLSDFQNRNVYQDELTLPVGFIVGNFAPPVDGKPSCLSFDEVNTLFHEFGHALHHTLTCVNVSDVAGISGVEWDAVELPSQFMENFLLTHAGIAKVSRHLDTQAPLPDEMLNALIGAKHFQTGLQTLRQMEFGLFDLRLHSQDKALNYQDILDVIDKVRQEIAVVIPPKNNRFGNGFSHIFAGGYACGYYSYIWAEVLSADAFAKFEEMGIFDRQTGEQFKNEILARGGSRPAKDSYVAFRGREATLDALLRHRGLVG